MAESLSSFIESLGPREKFISGPIFQPEADLLTIFFEDADHYAERVDKYLTVFLSFGESKLIGFELKGIRHKAEEMAKMLNPKPGQNGRVQVGVSCVPHINVLLTFYMKEPLGATRDAYRRVYERARGEGDLTVPSELVG